MADSQKSPSSATAGVTRTDENGEWPNRSRFRKKYQPYGVRICEETLDEIDGYHDCVVITDYETEEVRVQIDNEHGTLTALWGQWVMEDSDGDHYPITDEEIRETYEPVDEA